MYLEAKPEEFRQIVSFVKLFSLLCERGQLSAFASTGDTYYDGFSLRGERRERRVVVVEVATAEKRFLVSVRRAASDFSHLRRWRVGRAPSRPSSVHSRSFRLVSSLPLPVLCRRFPLGGLSPSRARTRESSCIALDSSFLHRSSQDILSRPFSSPFFTSSPTPLGCTALPSSGR
jgi:hypothetical protein